MKTLKRNHITIFYANPIGVTDAKDSFDDFIGEPEVNYEAPKPYKRFSWGARQGVITLDPFGIADGYLQPLVTDDMCCPVKDNTRLWIGVCPYDSEGKLRAHTHVVESVIPSINVIKVLCKAVSVS